MTKQVRTYRENPGQDKARQVFLTEHTGTPRALLGDQMEREAYLDILVPIALDAAAMPIKKRRPASSRT